MNPSDVEILVHTAAPTTRAEDDRHRDLALSYLQFECVKRHGLTETLQKSDAQISQTLKLNALEQNAIKKRAGRVGGDEKSLRKITESAVESDIEDSLLSSADFLDAPQGTGIQPIDSETSRRNVIDERQSYSKRLLWSPKGKESQKSETTSDDRIPGASLGYRNSKRFRLSSCAPQSQWGTQPLLKGTSSEHVTESWTSDETHSGVRGSSRAIDLNSQLPLSFGLRLPPHSSVQLSVISEPGDPPVVDDAESSTQTALHHTSEVDEMAEDTDADFLQPFVSTDASQTGETLNTQGKRPVAAALTAGIYDFSTFEVWIDSPPPKTSMTKVCSLPAQVTPVLEKLKANPAMATRYNPQKIMRQISSDDRGYWRFGTRKWPVKIQYEFWTSMREFLVRGDGGMATWMTREPPLNGESQLGIVSVWCWGELAEHMWLLLYVMSKGFTKKVPMAWYDGLQNVIVQMPTK